MSPTYQQKAEAQLFALAQAVRRHDGLTGELHDNELRLERSTQTGLRRETVTCSPRPSDGDRLWFWDSRRTPLGQADQIADVALRIAADMAPPTARPRISPSS